LLLNYGVKVSPALDWPLALPEVMVDEPVPVEPLLPLDVLPFEADPVVLVPVVPVELPVPVEPHLRKLGRLESMQINWRSYS
jgi:hypothetical protein